jgi:hypothetical protein
MSFTVGAIPQGTYQVWVYVWEDNFNTVFNLSFEGSVVVPNYNSGSAGTWRKLGPFQATINDGAVNIGATGGDAAISGIEIWRVNGGGSSARMAFFDESNSEMSKDENTKNGFDFAVFPNPSEGEVNIEFTTAEAGSTQLTIFDTRGDQVRVLFDDVLPADKHERISLLPEDWVNGVYILQLVNGRHVKHAKLVYAR